MRSVQKTTWNWQAATDADADSQQGSLQLPRQAMIQVVVMMVVALLLRFIWGHDLMAGIVGSLAGLFLGLGLLAPAAYARVHAFGRWLGRGVGMILLYALMVPFYGLFMTPAAFWLKLRGRDPMHREFHDPEHTYWIPRLKRDRGENIEKQFLKESRAARASRRPVGSVGWDGREAGK